MGEEDLDIPDEDNGGLSTVLYLDGGSGEWSPSILGTGGRRFGEKPRVSNAAFDQ